MKKRYYSILFLAALFFGVQGAMAQANNYNCVIKNVNQVSNTELDFDIWLEWTGTNTAYLAQLEAGINLNYAGIANGGTLSGSFVPGSADPSLPAAQQVPNLCEINTTSLQFRFSTPSISPNTSALLIPGAPGIRIGTLRITNTVSFTAGATPNLTWSFSPTSATTTRSRISAYVNTSTIPSGLVIQAGHSVNGNPVLSNTLPVSLSQFKGHTTSLADVLSWTTLSEKNNAWFELESSSDGLNFQTLVRVYTKALEGNSDLSLEYVYENTAIQQGATYYRLRQVDIDGSAAIVSQVIRLERSPIQSVKCFPNPIVNQAQIELVAQKAAQVQLMLMNMQGQIILNSKVQLNEGMNLITLPTNHLPASNYMLNIYSGQQSIGQLQLLKAGL
jgi:hypothetical protein